MHPVLDFLQLLGFLCYTCLRAIFLTIIPVSWHSKNVRGQVCWISGAGNGIGKQMAIKFSVLGCRMVLIDINKGWLEKTAKECKDAGAETVDVYVCDLSDREQVYLMAEKVKKDVGPVDILINNAGIVSAKPLLELDDAANIERTFKINAISHFWTIKAFLPDMLRRERGHIVTIASMAGITCASGKLMDYAASKYAAVGIGETLEFELRCVYKTNKIKSTVVCPYYINTGMFQGVSLKYEWLLPYLTPDFVAQQTVDAVLTNKPMVMLPAWLRIIAILK